MKKLTVLVLAICLFGSAKAQVPVELDPTQLTVSILPLMAHFEGKIATNQSLTFGGGLAYSAYYSNINGQENFEAYSIPFLTASFRNYYERKSTKKSNLRPNSGNYVGLLTSYGFESIIDIDLFGTVESSLDNFSIGPVWGIQRNYASGIHLDVSIGFGYVGYQSDELVSVDSGVNFIGGFEFGFRFN